MRITCSCARGPGAADGSVNGLSEGRTSRPGEQGCSSECGAPVPLGLAAFATAKRRLRVVSPQAAQDCTRFPGQLVHLVLVGGTNGGSEPQPQACRPKAILMSTSLGSAASGPACADGDQQHQDAQPGVRPDRGRRRVVVHVDVSTQVRLVDQLADEALELPAERAPSGKRRRDGRCGRPGRRGWIRRSGSARGNRAGGRCDSPQFVGEGLAHPGRILRRWSSHPPRARAWRR